MMETSEKHRKEFVSIVSDVFGNPPCEWEIMSGWENLVADVICEIHNELEGIKNHGFTFYKIEEKYGSLRIQYIIAENSPLTQIKIQKLQNLIMLAEEISISVCSCCGTKDIVPLYKKEGQVYSICPKCTK